MNKAIFILFFALMIAPAAIDAAPLMNLSAIVPGPNPTAAQDLSLYCQANDSVSSVIGYDYRIYRNGTLYNESIGGFCYQETANQTNACGGLDTGSYIIGGDWAVRGFNITDGDWDTYTYTLETKNSWLYVNYTKPPGVTSVYWRVKDSFGEEILSVPQECFDAYPDKIRFYHLQRPLFYRVEWYCLSSDESLVLLRKPVMDNRSIEYRRIYEEAVIWDGYYPGTLSKVDEISWSIITKGDSWTLSCRATNGTNTSSWLNSSTVTVINSPPEIGQLYIHPPGAQSGDNLTYVYVLSDVDNDTVTEESVIWYRNGTRVSALDNATTVKFGNTSLGDSWKVAVNVFDGEEWSPQYIDSPVMVIGDITPPAISGDSLSTTSGKNDNPFTITVTVSELNKVVYVYVEIEDPNGNKQNYSMSPGNSSGSHSKTYVPSTDGRYRFVFYSMDGSSNQAGYVSSLEYLETTEIGGAGGGGGGGGGVTSSDVETIVRDATKGYAALRSLGIPVKVGPQPLTRPWIKEVAFTAKDGDVEATIRISEDLKPFMSAKVCDPYTMACADQLYVKSGGQAYIEIVADLGSEEFIEAFEKDGRVQGSVEVLSYGSPAPTSYQIVFEKVWFYDWTLTMSEKLGLPHKTTHSSALAAMLGLISLISIMVIRSAT